MGIDSFSLDSDMPIWYPVPSALDFLVGFLDVGHHLASVLMSGNGGDFQISWMCRIWFYFFNELFANSFFCDFLADFGHFGKDFSEQTPASLWNLRNLKMIFLWTMFFGSDFDVQNFVRILEPIFIVKRDKSYSNSQGTLFKVNFARNMEISARD
ncbi:hypothetical protein RhiirA4_501985 [Rhizophagus irregularis]|uniref:Uncharacterized protein n=1 Tax=Rhizophagus irregularis TaxID=588596 RepID=A0A2I1H706_9GLOM|nr:hypothetical protein RhiirA4_501985 [Rhizophagus irregularis]